MPQIYNLQNLMVRDARMHKTGSHMDREAKTRKPASAFKPAGYIIRKSDSLFRNTQNHFPRFYNDVAAVFYMNSFGYILKSLPRVRSIEPGPICDLSSGSIMINLLFKASSISFPINTLICLTPTSRIKNLRQDYGLSLIHI